MSLCQILARSRLLFRKSFWALLSSVWLLLIMFWNFTWTESGWWSAALASDESCYEDIWCQEITREVPDGSTPAYQKRYFSAWPFYANPERGRHFHFSVFRSSFWKSLWGVWDMTRFPRAMEEGFRDKTGLCIRDGKAFQALHMFYELICVCITLFL